MDEANPLSTGTFGRETFARARHLVIDYGATLRPVYLQALDRAGDSIDVVARTPDPADLLHLIPGMDLVCALPELNARQFTSRLRIRACPIRAETEIHMYWPSRLNRSPLNQWLRDMIQASASALEPRPE